VRSDSLPFAAIQWTFLVHYSPTGFHTGQQGTLPMITKVEVMNAHDNAGDLDSVAIILRDLGYYIEADTIENVADDYRAIIDRMRMNVANDN
jgi:hypothetical protein